MKKIILLLAFLSISFYLFTQSVGVTGNLSVSGNAVINNKTIISPQYVPIDIDTMNNKIGFGRILDGSGWDVGLGIGGYNGNTWGLGAGGGSLYIGLGDGVNANSMKTGIEFNKNRNIFLSPNNSGNIGIGTSNPRGHLHFSNLIINRKLVLYQDDNLNDNHQFLGLGVNNFTLRFQVSNTSDSYKFYAGTSANTSNLLFTIGGDSKITAEGNAEVKGITDLKGALVLNRTEIAVSQNYQDILVGNKSNIVLVLTNPYANIDLSDGLMIGQILNIKVETSLICAIGFLSTPLYIQNNTSLTNINLASDYHMCNNSNLLLMWDGGDWQEIARSNNGN